MHDIGLRKPRHNKIQLLVKHEHNEPKRIVQTKNNRAIFSKSVTEYYRVSYLLFDWIEIWHERKRTQSNSDVIKITRGMIMTR